jgi:hypothetical protein
MRLRRPGLLGNRQTLSQAIDQDVKRLGEDQSIESDDSRHPGPPAASYPARPRLQ